MPYGFGDGETESLLKRGINAEVALPVENEKSLVVNFSMKMNPFRLSCVSLDEPVQLG